MFEAVSNVTDSRWLASLGSSEREHGRPVSVTGKHQRFTEATKGSDSSLNYEDYNTAYEAIECGVIPALCLLGLPANFVTMVVFYRQGLKDKMNLCLSCLALVDLLFLLCMLAASLYCPAALFTDAVVQKVLQWNALKYTLNFRNAFMYSSATLTAIIATERCICVVWPLKSATILNTKTMAWIIFGVIFVLNILCFPCALKNEVKMETDETGKVTVVFQVTQLYLEHRLAFQILRDTILPCISFLTFFVVSFVTVVTVRKLKTAMDWRQKTSSHVMDKRQLTLVKILITVSCVFIVCSFPKLLLSVVRFFVHEFSSVGKHRPIFFATHSASFALLMVNSSVNIFIYYRQSSRFRSELHACVCCYKRQH